MSSKSIRRDTSIFNRVSEGSFRKGGPSIHPPEGGSFQKEVSVESKRFRALSSDTFYPFQIESKNWKTVEHYVLFKACPLDRIKNAKTPLVAQAFAIKASRHLRLKKEDYYNANKIKLTLPALRKTLLNTDHKNILDEKHPLNRSSLLVLRREIFKEERESVKGKKMEVPSDTKDVRIRRKLIQKFVLYLYEIAKAQHKDILTSRMVEDALWNLGDTPRRRDNFSKITFGWLEYMTPSIIAKKMPNFEKRKDSLEKKLDNEEVAYLVVAFARGFEAYLTKAEQKIVNERLDRFVANPEEIIIRPL